MTELPPSLADRLPRPAPRLAATLSIIAASIGAGAAIVAVGATWQASAIAAASQRLATGTAAAARLRATAIAQAFARPSLTATLGAIAAHLPPEASLIGVERTAAGALRLTLDTSDPDALHASLAADPWLRRFRERAEDQREDGGFRVLLEAAS